MPMTCRIAALARSVEPCRMSSRGPGDFGAGGEQALLRVVEQRLEFGAQVVAVLVLAIGVSGLGIRVEIGHRPDRSGSAAVARAAWVCSWSSPQYVAGPWRFEPDRQVSTCMITCRTASP